MSSTALAFDALACFDRLKTAGVPEAQARIQAECFREQGELCAREIRQAIERYDESKRAELATKGDVQDVRLELEKVRAEVEKVRGETEKVRAEVEKVRAEVEKVRGETEKVRGEVEKVRAELKMDMEKLRAELKTDMEKLRAELKTDMEKVRAELKIDMGKVKYDLLRWQFGIALALAAIMAKGFGWLGF